MRLETGCQLRGICLLPQAAGREPRAFFATAGFTLVELVVILIIVGVLAVAAIPRFVDKQTFEAQGFFDQALAMARYGQKVAIARHTDVFFNADAGSNTICLTTPVADATCGAGPYIANPADGASFRVQAPNGVTLSASVSFRFTALGKPIPDAAVSLGIVGDGMTRTLLVERETGYVHQ